MGVEDPSTTVGTSPSDSSRKNAKDAVFDVDTSVFTIPSESDGSFEPPFPVGSLVKLTSRVSRACPQKKNPEHVKDLKAGTEGVVMEYNEHLMPIVKFQVEDEGKPRELTHLHKAETLILADSAEASSSNAKAKGKAKAKTKNPPQKVAPRNYPQCLSVNMTVRRRLPMMF